MAMDFGTAFGGLAQGLAKGFQTGVDISQRQEALELQKAESGVRLIGALHNLSKMPADMRRVAGPGLMRQFEKTYGAEIPPAMRDVFIKGNDEQVGRLTGIIADAVAGKKIDPTNLKESLQGLDLETTIGIMSKVSGITSEKERIALERQRVGLAGAALATPERRTFESTYREYRAGGMSDAEASRRAFADVRGQPGFNLDREGLTDYLRKNPGSSPLDYMRFKADIGTRPTALKQNVDYLSGVLRIKPEEAAKILTSSREQSDQQFYANIYGRIISGMGAAADTAEADRLAKEAVAARRQYMGQPPAAEDNRGAPPAGPAPRTGTPGQPPKGEGDPLPFDPGGKLDMKRLRPGTIYRAPDGKRGKWNGKAFEEVP